MARKFFVGGNFKMSVQEPRTSFYPAIVGVTTPPRSTTRVFQCP